MLIQIFNDILTISIKSIPFILLLIVITVLFQRKLHPLVIEVIWILVFIRLVIPVDLPIEIDFLTADGSEDRVVLVESFSDYYVKDKTKPLELIGSNDSVSSSSEFISYKYILSIIWIVIAITILSYTFIKSYKFGKKLKLSSFKRSTTKENIPLVETEDINFPIIFGYFEPVIYIPVNLWEILSSKEKEYLLFHENSHHKRKDILTGWIYFIVLSIHWFNPLVWLSYILIQNLKEISCDRQVLNKLCKRDHISYAKTLLKVGEICSSNYSNVSIARFAGRSSIKKRIEMIISKSNKKLKWSLVTATLVVIVALMFITDPLALGYYKPKIVGEWFLVKTYYRTDYPLKKDKNLIGTWLNISSTEDIDSFDPFREELEPRDEYFIVVKSDGTTSEGLNWTRGIFINKKDSFTLEYKIKDIDGNKYLFMERLDSFESKSNSYSVFVKYNDDEYKEDLYIPPTSNSNIEVQLPQGTIDPSMSIRSVIDLLGKPLNYYSDFYSGNRYIGSSELDLEELPNKFVMDYGDFEICFIYGHLYSVVIHNKKITYKSLVIGESLEEVFTKIAKPAEIKERRTSEFESYILYKNSSRVNYYHYYRSPRDSMTLKFENGYLDQIIVGFTL